LTTVWSRFQHWWQWQKCLKNGVKNADSVFGVDKLFGVNFQSLFQLDRVNRLGQGFKELLIE